MLKGKLGLSKRIKDTSKYSLSLQKLFTDIQEIDNKRCVQNRKNCLEWERKQQEELEKRRRETHREEWVEHQKMLDYYDSLTEEEIVTRLGNFRDGKLPKPKSLFDLISKIKPTETKQPKTLESQ